MTGAFPNQANPGGVDLGRVGPFRAGMLKDASFSVGFTYGYSRCPASRDVTHSAGLTEGGSYISAYGPPVRALLDRPFGASEICHLRFEIAFSILGGRRREFYVA